MSIRNVFLACSLATFVFAATLTMSDLATAGGKSNSGKVTNSSQETRKLEEPINETRTNKSVMTTKAAAAKKGKVNSSPKLMAPASNKTTSGNTKALYDPPFKK